jgi:Sec-independent protein translocase protein TatA
VRGFKKAMNEGENEESNPPPKQIRSEGTDAEFPEVAKTQNREAGTAKTTDRPA